MDEKKGILTEELPGVSVGNTTLFYKRIKSARGFFVRVLSLFVSHFNTRGQYLVHHLENIGPAME